MEIEDRTQHKPSSEQKQKCPNTKCMGCAVVKGLEEGTYSYKTDSFMRVVITRMMRGLVGKNGF